MNLLKKRIEEAEQALKNGTLTDKEYKDLRKDFNDLMRVLDTYKAYDKNSYVRLSDITTISKLRIERINKYDPSGRIRLSSQQMALISHKLMQLFLNK